MSDFKTDALNKAYEDFSSNRFENLRDRVSYNLLRSSDILDYEKSLSILDGPIGQITSRDQIIDPYSLVDQSKYSNTLRGRSQYNQDLARAELFAKRQEAAYQEWYNSEFQQAQRQFDAGLNPNLLGVDPSSASSVDPSGANAFEGLPTNSDLRAQRISNAVNAIGAVTGIVSSLSSVASLATSFKNLQLVETQNQLLSDQSESLRLDNLSKAEALFSQGIGNHLSNAISSAVASGQILDIDSWFADDKNFEGLFESYGFSDNILFRDAFKRARDSRQKIAKLSYDATTGTLSSQKSYAEALADPTYDKNVLLQRSFMEPVMDAEFKLRKARLDFEDKILSIKNQYVDNLDVEGIAESVNNQAYQAEYDLYLKSCQSIIEGSISEIYENWRDGYNANKDNAVGMAYSYLITNRGHLQWEEYLGSHVLTGIFKPEYEESDSSPSLPIQPSGLTPNSDFKHYGQNWFSFPGTLNFGN